MEGLIVKMKQYTIECCDGTTESLMAPNLETAYELADEIGLAVDCIFESSLAYQQE
jgi:hypothetical protein